MRFVEFGEFGDFLAELAQPVAAVGRQVRGDAKFF